MFPNNYWVYSSILMVNLFRVKQWISQRAELSGYTGLLLQSYCNPWSRHGKSPAGVWLSELIDARAVALELLAKMVRQAWSPMSVASIRTKILFELLPMFRWPSESEHRSQPMWYGLDGDCVGRHRWHDSVTLLGLVQERHIWYHLAHRDRFFYVSLTSTP